MKIEADFLEKQAALEAACRMVTAARTAPKTRGRDNIQTFVLEKDELERLSLEMERLGQEANRPSFLRDAKSIRLASCVVFIGTKLEYLGLEESCGFCGRKNCLANKESEGICIYNPLDLGIALGSAVSVAADCRVDTRLMFSAGKAALSLGLFPPEVKIAIGIPISISGKNPFFDRIS